MTTATAPTPATLPERKKKFRFKFRLLSGLHIDYHPTARHPDGSRVEVTYRQNDIIETDIDLAARFNQGTDSIKFEKLFGEGQVIERVPEGCHAWDPKKETIEQFTARMKAIQGQAAQTTTQAPPPVLTQPSAKQDNTLDNMTLEELKALAAEEEIDLKGQTKRENILRIVKAKYGV